MSESPPQRIERILEKLTQVRRKEPTCFGADSHKFRLNPPIDEQALSRFENEHHIKLPPDYRSFLKLAGNGGAGPYYGFYKLDEWKDFVDWTTDDVPSDILALPCPLHPEMQRVSDWQSKFSNCVSPYQGMISIGSQGCTYAMGLIVTGEYAGRVVYLDADGQAPYVVRESDFLSWYERWLDELLGGNDMFWFGYGIGGDESQLLELLEDQTKSDSVRMDAIYAIRRLPRLSQRGRERICRLVRDPVAGVRAAACSVAEKFKIGEAAPFISDLLHDESAEVRKAAIGMSTTLLGDSYSEDIIQLLQSDNLELAQRAFFQLQELKRLPRAILLQLVQSSPHGGLRYLAAHAVNWRPKDESLLIRLLHDEHSQVRFHAVLGLRQNGLRSSLDAVIKLLDQETEGHTIDAILGMLGEVPGDKNGDVLLAWTHRGDDFQRLSAIDSLCKLGDIRVEPVAQLLMRETRSPVRRDENGFSSMSHAKPICDFVSESLRSSPNRTLSSLVSTTAWPKFLRFWKSSK